MTTVRWVSFLLAAECLVALFFTPNGVGSMILAALFFLFFLILCWSLGAFDRTDTTSKGTTP